MMSEVAQRIGVGVIGATGFIAEAYREEIRADSGSRIVALCARRKELLERAARMDGAALATPDWREVVEHPDVDLVIVATPDVLHCEAALECAERGKHVVCEKPVGADAREAAAVWTAYRDRPHLAHFVPFWTRYLDMFARAREFVAQGLVGEVRTVVYRWSNPRPAGMPFTWRDDPALSAAGSIADGGSHAYDLMRWILGREAVRVLAHADTLAPTKPDFGAINLAEALERGAQPPPPEAASRRGGTADYASVAWDFEDGPTGVLLLSHAPHLRRGLAPELELHGAKASLGVDRVTGTLVLVRPGKPPEVLETHPEHFGNRFSRHVFPAVRAAVAGESSHHPSLEDGYRVQLFTDAVAESAKLGRWVEVGGRS